MKKLSTLLILTAHLMGDGMDTAGVRMPDIVLDAIKHCECLKEADGQCNPNVIRINAVEDAQRAQMAGFAVNGHIIKCNSTEECSAQTQALINGGITNLDLGPYQINYKYHPVSNLSDYFVDATEREHANHIITKFSKKFWLFMGNFRTLSPF